MDNQEVVRRINAFKKNKKATELDLSGLGLAEIPKEIEELKDFPNLKELDLSNNEIQDITILKCLSNLTFLYLNGNQIQDISTLTNMSEMSNLELKNNQIQDISALKNMSKLIDLALDNNQIQDISVLENLSCLKNLWLNSNKVQDLSVFKKIEKSKIENLGLSNNKIQDIEPLASLKDLYRLDLVDNKLSNISILGTLENLHILILANNQIQDITNLKKLNKLYALVLSNNQISDKRAWQTFFAKGQKGKNAVFFGELSKNTEKWLDKKAPKGIESLKKLSNIQILLLNGNQISEVDFLEMPSLHTVYLGGNPIESIKTGAKPIEINFESDVENDEILSRLSQLMQLGVGMDKKIDDVGQGVNNLLIEWPKLGQDFKDNFDALCAAIKEVVGWNDIVDKNYAEQLQNEWQGRDSSKLFDVSNCSDDLRCALFLFDVISQKEHNYTPCIALLCRALEAEFKGFFMNFANSTDFATAIAPRSLSPYSPKDDFCNFLINRGSTHTSLGEMKDVLIGKGKTGNGKKHKQAREYAKNKKFDAAKFSTLVTKIGKDVSSTSNKILYFRNKSAHPGKNFSKADAEACKVLVFDLLKDWIDARR